jgi:hypothetical protein
MVRYLERRDDMVAVLEVPVDRALKLVELRVQEPPDPVRIGTAPQVRIVAVRVVDVLLGGGAE